VNVTGAYVSESDGVAVVDVVSCFVVITMCVSDDVVVVECAAGLAVVTDAEACELDDVIVAEGASGVVFFTGADVCEGDDVIGLVVGGAEWLVLLVTGAVFSQSGDVAFADVVSSVVVDDGNVCLSGNIGAVGGNLDVVFIAGFFVVGGGRVGLSLGFLVEGGLGVRAHAMHIQELK